MKYFTLHETYPLLIAFIFYIFSSISFYLKKEKLSVILLLLASFFTAFFVASLDPFLNVWDERFHALVAKNLTQHPLKPILIENPLFGYEKSNWAYNYIWLHKQPLFLWQISLSIKLFGLNALAVRLPSIILHTLTTLLVFQIGKNLVNFKTGFLAAFLFSLSHFSLELISDHFPTDHNDVAFLFYVTLSFWAWIKYVQTKKLKWIILIGFAAGAAVLVKWLLGLLIFPIWTITILSKINGNRFLIKDFIPLVISGLVSVVVFLPWQIYIFNEFPSEALYEYKMNSKRLFEVVEGHSGTWIYHFDKLQTLYGQNIGYFIIPIIGIVLLTLQTKAREYKILIISSVVIIYGLFTLSPTKMLAYPYVVSPFIFLGFISILFFIREKLLIYIHKKLVTETIICLLFIWFCWDTFKFPRVIELHTFSSIHKNHDRALHLAEQKVINHLLENYNQSDQLLFNVKITAHGNISTMFYTNHNCFEFIPTQEQINEVLAKKYKVLVFDYGQLPNYLVNNKNVKLIDVKSLVQSN
jgi:4-amino-4-deoxy-L-arabinose transferase-like glycosyltransferase